MVPQTDPDARLGLRQVVQKYLTVGGDYGRSVALSALGLSAEEIEDVFSKFEEDYHIGRFLQFQCAAGANYNINGFPQTHVSISAEIQSIL